MEGVKTGIGAETVCRQLKEPVFFIDATRTLAFGNERFFDVTGLSEADTIGEADTLLQQFMADDFEAFREGVEAVLAGDATDQRIDLTMHHPAEAPVPQTLPAEARLVAVDEDGVHGVLVTLRDASDRAEYERRLEERTEQLLVLNRLLRHDIGNNVAVIEGWAELLADRCEGSAKELVDRIQSAAVHIRELTREASGVMQMLQKQGEMTRKPVAFGETLLEEIEKVRRTHPEATITAPAEEDLPDVQVRANDLLGSVFTNVITNAIVHNDADAPRIDIDVEQQGERVVARFADNGPGIPDDRKDAILATGEDELDGDGSGIGLYLVSTLVEEFGGSISISDNDPTGTVFTIELPVIDE